MNDRKSKAIQLFFDFLEKLKAEINTKCKHGQFLK